MHLELRLALWVRILLSQAVYRYLTQHSYHTPFFSLDKSFVLGMLGSALLVVWEPGMGAVWKHRASHDGGGCQRLTLWHFGGGFRSVICRFT